MKQKIFLLVLLLCSLVSFAQKTSTQKETPVPCNGSADDLPGKYTNHTNPKYPSKLKGTAQEVSVMTKTLIAIEKLEEASRKDFNLTGCVARVSFTRGGNNSYKRNVYIGFGYQLGVYQNVCHATQHIVKTVDEYRTVFRVDINPFIRAGGANPASTGEFYSNYGNPVYVIPIEAKMGPDFEKEKVASPSHVSQYISEQNLLNGWSDDYKNKHSEFLKLNNGNGYVESGWGDARYKSNRESNAYLMIDRHYYITKPGVPLLIPVSRKQYLEDMLEYFEIEKANFDYLNSKSVKDYEKDKDKDWAIKKLDQLATDRLAYPKFYEAKKAKLKDLLAKQKPEWLQKPAIVDQNTVLKDFDKILDALGRFYDEEAEYKSALYVLNPAYFMGNNGQSTKPLLIEVQFRYEISKDKGFSTRLFNNWEKNFDMNALKKMVE